MRNISSIKVGDRYYHTEVVTCELHDEFTRLSGDNSPIHTSIEFAKANGYPGCIGYAFLLTALLSKIYGTQFPGGSELCLKQDCNFPKPYFVGDTLTFAITVKNVNVSLRIVTAHTEVVRGGDEVMFKGGVVFQLCLE